MTSKDRREMHSIVDDLANSDIDDHEGDCAICGAWLSLDQDHESDCPYQRAVEIIKRVGKKDDQA